MIYLKEFNLPSDYREQSWLYEEDVTKKANLNHVYLSKYPFEFFSKYSKKPSFKFSEITVFYGGNGSGKSTLLNIIAAKLGLKRNSLFNSSPFFLDYCNICDEYIEDETFDGKIITSDDIFQKLHDTRGINQITDKQNQATWDRKHEMLYEIYDDPSLLRLHGLDDYERFKEYQDAIRQSSSKFIRQRCRSNIESHSNGETALQYLTSEITENAIYLLDEPENSLSPAFQNDLKIFLEDSAHYFRCQFIIATHSPLLLAMNNAVIYNLDDECKISKWYELENIRAMASLFKQNADKFIDV